MVGLGWVGSFQVPTIQSTITRIVPWSCWWSKPFLKQCRLCGKKHLIDNLSTSRELLDSPKVKQCVQQFLYSFSYCSLKSPPPPAFLPCSDLSGQTKKKVRLPMSIYYLPSVLTDRPATLEHKLFWATPNKKLMLQSLLQIVFFQWLLKNWAPTKKTPKTSRRRYDMTTQHLLRAPKRQTTRESQIGPSSGRFGILRIAAGHPHLCHLIRSSDSTDWNANPPRSRLPRVTWWVTTTF